MLIDKEILYELYQQEITNIRNVYPLVEFTEQGMVWIVADIIENNEKEIMINV
jgi:hypothetical protein